MGTRGAFGFRFRDEDKLTYNHFDSYPTGLGVEMVAAVRDFDDEQLAGTASRIIIVDESAKPTEADKARYAAVADLGVSEKSLDDWYCLLRDAQGEPAKYIDGTFDHMSNGNDFVRDGLFCEWAYVINCDTRHLEVYRGFMDGAGEGRYAGFDPNFDPAYAGQKDHGGVGLLTEISFDDLRALSDAEAAELLTAWEKLAYGEEE